MSTIPELIEKASSWVTATAQRAVQVGTPLSASGVAIAKRVGVSRPELIRILVVEQMPTPDDIELREIATSSRLLSPTTAGLTLAYAVFLRKGCDADARLLAHELRHVYQYESAGSVKGFLSVYIPQILTVGYENAPLEIDAQSHEHLGY